MHCNDAEGRLNDHIDGLLSEAESQALEAHLETCPACRRAEGELRAIVDAAGALPKAVVPQRELWPAIEGRLQNQSPAGAFRSRFGRTVQRRALPFAAALALTVAAMYGAVLWRTPGYVKAEAEYLRSRTELLATIEARGDTLSPGTMETVEGSLRVIDEAVQEIRAAIEDDPGNPRLVRMLMATHRKELDFLVEVVRMPQSLQTAP